MNWKGKCGSQIFLMGMFAIFLTFPGFSQVHFKGKVIYEADAKPAAYATIELMHQTGGSQSDKSGNFSFYISNVKNDDTLRISSIGYESLKIPVSLALKRSEFALSKKSYNLDTVVVKSFTTQQVIGANAEDSAYFRSWDYNRTGGEIGRIFKLPYKEYKIDKIRFKVSNRCDTCRMRLHIRKVMNSQPGDELIGELIEVYVKNLSMDDKNPEFDLSPYDFTFTQKEIFVSMEVIDCKNNTGKPCSFCFIGTEEGGYWYKSKATSYWARTDDYTIYLKLFLRY